MWSEKVRERIYSHIDDNLFSKKKINYVQIFDEVLNKFNSQIVLTEEIDCSEIQEIIRKKKYNWFNNEKNNENSSYNKQIKAIHTLFNNKQINLKFKNEEEYIQDLNKKIKIWFKDDHLLIDYPYINNKRKTTIEKALEEDILLALYLEKKYEMKDNSCEIMLNSLNNIPIDISDKLKLQETEENFLYEYKNNSSVYIYTIEINDFNNILASDEASKVINIIRKVLNKTDIRVFNYLLKYRDKNFFENGDVEADLGQMSKDLFGYNKEYYRNNIIGSVYKMSVIKVSGFSNGITRIVTSLLNDVVLEKKDNRLTISASVSKVYRNDVLRGNITKIYGNMFDKIKNNDDIYIIAFYLQSRRLQQYFCKDKDIARYAGFCEKRIPYTDISNYCMISGKNKSRAKKRISTELKLIADENIIISDFDIVGDYYNITYAPLSEEELDDLENRIRLSDKCIPFDNNKLEK